MTRMLIDQTILGRWKTLFETTFKGAVETLASSYPDKKSLILDYWELDKASSDMTDYLMKQPSRAFYHAEKALSETDTANDVKLSDVHIRIKNLPHKTPLSRITVKNIGAFISIEGLVKRVTEPKPLIKEAVFECNRCGASIRIEQLEEIIKEPAECFESQGGCGRKSSFRLNKSQSLMRDIQKAEVQEFIENTQGKQPEKMTLHLEDDLIRSIYPGEEAVINGYIQIVERRKGMEKSTMFNKVFIVNDIEKKETKYEDIALTDVDIQKIRDASKDPLLFDKLVQSIAPSIHGYNIEKMALILQMVGGVSKELDDGTRTRGDIHVLLVGDPGTSKSQLLTFVSKASPRSVFCDGKGSSAAGLTFAVVRDDFGEGQWSLEAGALVLADGGIACVDELDKMSEEDRNALHTALEQGEVHCSKAGINATLRTRCSMLAAANPKEGRFDEFTPIAQQIDLPVTLLSRFDLIFPIIDKPDKERDAEIAEHISRVHKNNIKEPFFNPSDIKKYVSYARRIKPILEDSAIEKINKYYLAMRWKSNENIAITPRQLEALYRLSEASAKLRLSESVNDEDAGRAIEINEEYMRRIGIDHETGKYDIDTIILGKSSSQRERMHTLRNIITVLCKERGDASMEDIIIEAKIFGLSEEKVEKYVEQMKIDGQIYEPKSGRYRLSGK